jgi:tRNA/rRNA methyltransferase
VNKKKLKQDRTDFHRMQQTSLSPYDFTIILLQPETAGNIGSIARLMKNFDLEKLVLFDPIESVEEIYGYKAQGYAMHGKEILLNAKLIDVQDPSLYITSLEIFLREFDLIIATTAKGIHYRNIKRVALFPEDLRFPASSRIMKIAIVFGKESKGLTNEELELADIILRIPTGNSYPTLNLSHACGIILYELFKKANNVQIGRGNHPVILADREDRQFLYKIIKDLISKLKIRTYKADNVFLSFKNMIERSFISQKELSLITGVFTKIHSVLMGLHLYDE